MESIVGSNMLGCFESAHLRAHLSDFFWDRPPHDLLETRAHIIDLALTPRSQSTWATFSQRGRVPRQVGSVMFVPAGHTLCSGTSAGQLRSLTCFLSPELIEQALGYQPSFAAISEASALHLRDPELRHVLIQISDELARPRGPFDDVVEALAKKLIPIVIRTFALDQTGLDSPRKGGIAPWRMRRIQDRVHADLQAPHLAELASLCDMSVRHLTRAFKAETGQTITDFVRQVTIERIQTLLTDTAMPVAEIANVLGFPTSSSLCSAFRRSTGRRPSEQRALGPVLKSEPAPPRYN